MSKRKPRVEIKVVTKDGTLEYWHCRGDIKPDGTPTDGPNEREFKIATNAILEILNILPAKDDEVTDRPAKESVSTSPLPNLEKLERIFRLVNRWCTRPESVLREGAMVLANDAEMWKKLRELVKSS